MKKGDRLYVEGRIEYSESESDGQKKYWTNVNVFEMVMLGSTGAGGQGGGGRGGGGERAAAGSTRARGNSRARAEPDRNASSRRGEAENEDSE